MPKIENLAQTLETANVLYVDLVIDPSSPGPAELTAEETRRFEHELPSMIAATRAFDDAQKSGQVTLQPGDHTFALLFFGDLEIPVQCAAELSRALRTHSPHLKTRMGVHAGPAYRD